MGFGNTKFMSLTGAAAFLMATVYPGKALANMQDNPQDAGGMAISSQSGNVAKTVPPARDGEAVTAEEFRFALGKGTREALIRFIARHPGHKLSRQALAMLHGKKVFMKAGADPADPDANIYAAFDRAIRSNTVAAYQSFTVSYPNHPLVMTARQLRDQLLRASP